MATAMLVASVTTARADDPGVAQGQQLYAQYCASCHGSTGKGDGPEGRSLTTPKASDLTQIAKGNNGKFPFYETMLIIEGRTPDAQNQDTLAARACRRRTAAPVCRRGARSSRDRNCRRGPRSTCSCRPPARS